jgi:signal transduction histidine kinase
MPNRDARLTSQITVALMVMMAIAVALIAGFAWLASTQVDKLALGRQSDIVANELDEQIKMVAKEQRSIAIRDDTVTYTRAGDQQWMAATIGTWLHTYFGHDRGLVLNDRNEIIFSAREGKPAFPPSLAADRMRIDAVASEVRRRLVETGSTPETSAAVREISVTKVALIEGRPAIVSIRPILPGTTRVTVPAGSEFLQVAVKFLDGDILGQLGEHSSVSGVRYVPERAGKPEAAVRVVGLEGNILGYVSWTPIRPGLMLIKKIVPGALLGFLIAAGAVLYLGLGLRRASRALLSSRMELIKHRSELEETVKLRTAEVERQAAELDRMLQQERHVNALQRQFVSMASHEFRTPLAVIDAAAQRLMRQREAPTPAYIAEKGGQIRQSVARMVELMESILSAGRLSEGIGGIHPTDVDLAELVKKVCKRQTEIGKSHEFHIDFTELPMSVKADASALEQVFTNLVSNAIKYAPAAPDIFIRGRTENGMVHISFRDQGIGMDAEDIPKLFQPYFRARSSTGIAGTGIGLNLVKQIIDLHGGSIDVKSELGRGTTFTLSLAVNGNLTPTATTISHAA